MRTLCLLLASVLFVSLGHAQSSPSSSQFPAFTPSHWLPLTLGNAWHYSFTAGGVSYQFVNRVVADTVVDGHRWAHVRTVWTGPNQPAGSSTDLWYAFTPDHYVVSVSGGKPHGGFSRADLDTFYVSSPRSLFATRSTEPASDLRLCNGLNHPVRVTTTDDPAIRAFVRDAGQASDTTHFALVIGTGGSGGEGACRGTFVYRVGQVNGLVGALVDGREWGDASLVRSVVTKTEGSAALPQETLLAYPSPARDHVTLRADGLRAPAHAVVYTPLGQRVARVALTPGGAAVVPLDWPAGVYFVRLEGTSVVRSFVVQPR